MEQKLAVEILSEIKRLLKSQKISYADLARHLRISESTLKKQMNAGDCSLSRLERICQLLQISVADIIRAIEDQNLQGFEFSPTQEDFFIHDREGFLLFWLLVYERRSLEEAQNVLKLSERQAWSILHKLDKQNLLKIMPGDKLRLPRIRSIRWVGRSRFIKDLYEKWSTLLIRSAISHLHADDQFLMVRYFRMTETSFEDLKNALKKLETEYSNLAVREMKVQSGPLLHVRWLMAADTRSFADEEVKSVR